MKKHERWYVLGLVLLYLILLLTFKRNIFTYKFSPQLIQKYYLSQDITREVFGKRLFLSDADIYLASGYLYITGADPTAFNFEHPPFMKYVFGLSTFAFNNPYYGQILFGIGTLLVMYLLTKKVTKSIPVAFLATFLLVVDPLFIDISAETLLDMGLVFFLLTYVLTMFFYKDKPIVQGLALGLMAGTKFWITALFFVGVITLYKIYKKDIDWKKYILHLVVAFATYSLMYLPTFIYSKGKFNIVWHVLKTLKYMLKHDISSFPGASIVMYLTSYTKLWWGDRKFVATWPWSPLWPISLGVTLYLTFKDMVKKSIHERTIVYAIPLLYLCYLGIQAPFSRYFLIVLPFSYLALGYLVYHTTPLKHHLKSDHEEKVV